MSKAVHKPNTPYKKDYFPVCNAFKDPATL